MTEQADQITHELKRLYELHDKRLTDDRLGFLLVELSYMKVPLQAIILGIRKLASSNVSSLKFSVISNAIMKEYEPITRDAPRVVKCIHCDSLGRITFVDNENRQCALACMCENGRVYRDQGITAWNGSSRQNINGQEMIRYEYKLLGEKQYNKHYSKSEKRNEE
jgi:hypothetical protein